MRTTLSLLALLPVLGWAAGPSAAELAGAIQQAGLDPQECYLVRDLSLFKDDIHVYLNDGYLIFSRPVAGERAAAVFTSAGVEGGDGEILLLPPRRDERKSLATFTGSPNLDEHFRSALLLFTDDTGRVLRDRIVQDQAGHKDPEAGETLARQWAPAVSSVTGTFMQRLLLDLLLPARGNAGFLALSVSGKTLGTFDVLYEPRSREQIQAGQLVQRDQQRVYDVWASFPARRVREGAAKPEPASSSVTSFSVTKFRIEASLDENLRLSSLTRATMTIGASATRVFPFEISRAERVTAARIDGKPVELFFADAAAGPPRENDEFLIVAPDLLPAGSAHEIEIEHAGSVIASRGNGVYSVDARSNWYPRSGADFAAYELRFRYPKRLTLVTPGNIAEDQTDGDFRVTERRTPVPIRVAGFNLGDYEKSTSTLAGLTVEVYGNRGLDPALQRSQPAIVPQPATPTPRGPRRAAPTVVQVPTLADPLARLNAVARDVSSTFQYYSELFGPPPLKSLTVSPIPGTFGQGFPGLVYLSTIAYLDPRERPPAAGSERMQTFFSDLMVAHEVAHQWWGNVVIEDSYQDEWLLEALANYSAMLWLEKKKGPKALEEILAGFRDDLVKVGPDGQTTESFGPVTWGYRLEAAKSPEALRDIMYEKGAWILHMLRQRLGDQRFLKMLSELRRRHEFRPVTSAELKDLAREFQPPGVKPDSLDAFFDSWVYSTGIPSLKVRYTVKGAAPAFKVAGTLEQSGVDDDFSVDVPVEIRFAKGAPLVVWVRSGESAGFSATVKEIPAAVDAGSGVLAVRK